MGYNISEVSGGSVGSGTSSVDIWTFTADLDSPSVTIVGGDFNVAPVPPLGGAQSEADEYIFGALNTTQWGTLSFDTNTGVFTFTIDRAAIFASGTDQTVSFTVTGVTGTSTDTDTVFIDILFCVARGTVIETPSGPVPVEELCPGDLVLTEDGRQEPIRWLGTRTVTSAELSADPSLRPIRISASAFGRGLPARDLCVSPQHRILVTGWRAELLFGEDSVLVPAKGLVDDHLIGVDYSADEVQYFHLLFDRHEVILTEGLPTESFYPGPQSMGDLDGQVRAELLRIFPQLEGKSALFEPAAPGLRVWEARLLARRPS